MDFLAFGYAATIALGGVIGYAKAGSLVSLVMGLSCGCVAGIGALQISQDPKNVALLLGVSAFLLCLMGYRALNSGKFMPAGLVAALSLLMVLRLGMRMIS